MFAVYGDLWQSDGVPEAPPTGITHYLLAFWTTSGAQDAAAGWTSLSSAQRKQLTETYAKAGVKIMVSAFGSTDYPTNADPVDTARKLAAFVKEYGLAGVDVDYEDSNAFVDGSAVPWLVTLHKTLRQQLPQGQFIITHAPQAPYFSSQCPWRAGWASVYRQVPDVDALLVQMYNQGANMYATCQSLLHSSGKTCPGSSLFEIHKEQHVPLSKLVVGKPATQADASNGWMDPSVLGKCLAQARQSGWNAGMTFWQYPHLTTSMLQAAKQAAGWT